MWPDLAINILSSLLLGASNNCAQLLSSPTRHDIDKAHAKGKWLDIGVPSVRNLGHISGWRVLLWALLFLSSIPLHLVYVEDKMGSLIVSTRADAFYRYNSVVFSTLSSVDYQSALVTKDFVEGGWWNQSRIISVSYPAPNMRQLEQMQASAVSGNLTRLDNAECIQAYGHSAFQSTWKNVLLVTSATKNDTLIDFWNHGATDKETSENWLCGLDKYDTTCDINKLAKNPAEWIISICQAEIASNEDGSYRQCDKFDAPILYCLAELFPQHCTVRVSLKLLTVVIIFNAIKVGCLLTTALSRNFNPLGTVGDAISSFLEHPDDKTASLGPISMAVVKTEAWRKKFIAGGPGTSCSIKRKPRRWARAVSIRRWLLCITL